MPESNYDPASHYDRVTEAWSLLLGEELHYGVFRNGDEALPEATRELTRVMVDAARLEPGNRVLDVGCGTGGPACYLASEHGVHVVGITTSDVGVQQGRIRAQAEGVADLVTFDNRDGMANGFPDDSFDRVWVLESSHLMRDRDALIRECARVVRPGGRISLCDIMLRRPMPFLEVRRLHKEFSLLRDVFGDARMEAMDHYTELFDAAGLTVDVAEDLTTVTRPTFDRWRSNARDHHDAVTALLSSDDLERFVESCDVLESFWDDGTLGYGLIAAQRP